MINIEIFHRTPVRGRLYVPFSSSSTEAHFGITESSLTNRTEFLWISTKCEIYNKCIATKNNVLRMKHQANATRYRSVVINNYTFD